MKKTQATTTIRLCTPRQYRAVRQLMSGPCSVRELFISVGANGIPQLISSLRAKGLQIDTDDRKGEDRDGRPVSYCVYVLSKESQRKAFNLLASYAGELQ